MTNSEMYRNLVNNIYIIAIFLSLFSVASAEVSIYDLLEKQSNNIKPISKIYEGKPVIKDLFNKNLDLVKSNEVKITNQAINKIQEFYANQNCYLKNSDILNIVINSNYWSLYTLESTLTETSKQKSWMPSNMEINKSYQKILDCKNLPLQQNNYKDLKKIENEVNWLYSKIIDNEYKIETKNQDNFWEDLFRNWNTKDSSFDILEDIYNIWRILMQDFNKQVKLYFYEIPKDWESSTLSFNNIIWKKLASNEDITEQGKESNADIHNFISEVNQTKDNDLGSYEELNQCIEIEETDTQDTQENISNEEYKIIISWVQDFIKNANSDTIVNDILVNKFKEEVQLKDPTWEEEKEQEKNNKIEKFVDNNVIINKSCADNCLQKKDIWEQSKCELDCSLSCFKKCEDIESKIEKTICKSECICFIVSWPEEPLVNWLIDSDIYKLRFCKTPVTNTKIQRNKTVESVEDIVYEMNNVFKNLMDWWEMIKHVQTKEFFELPVKINFWKLFSFGLNINRKKIPNTKKSNTLISQKEKENKKQEETILNTNSVEWEKDNYNKYIIIQSVSSNNANIQNISSINQRLSELSKEKETDQLSKKHSEDNIKNSQNEKTISLSNQIEVFLSDNISFRQEFEIILSDWKDIAYSLKEKIKSSE